MDKCSPVEMRKNLMIVDHLKRCGMDFVAIPARDQSHKGELIAQHLAMLEELLPEDNKG